MIKQSARRVILELPLLLLPYRSQSGVSPSPLAYSIYDNDWFILWNSLVFLKIHRLTKVRILSEKWTYLVYKSNWILNSYLGINWKLKWFLFQWILSVSPFKMRKRIQYVILKRLSLSFRSLRKFEMEQLIFTSDSS